MRLVMIFESGDKYTWCSTQVVPIESESPEDAITDFEENIKVRMRQTKPWKEPFQVFGKNFWVHNFYEDGCYVSPKFLTLDEWFEPGKLRE